MVVNSSLTRPPFFGEKRGIGGVGPLDFHEIIHQRENLGLEALHLVRQQAWKHLGGWLFVVLNIVIC